MVYNEDSSAYLKDCFKFYKTFQLDSEQLMRIDESARSIAYNCWDFSSSGSAVSFPEGLFLLRNVLSEPTLSDLLYESLVVWTGEPSKACNLKADTSDLWPTSLKEIALGYSWDRTLMGKLRWITFGYHYQWTQRRYEQSKRGCFPPLLAQVSIHLVELLRTELSSTNSEINSSEFIQACSDYRPEAAIVNYYRGKTTMGFHTDEVEFDKKAPLVSISLGPSAVYLWEVSMTVTAKPGFPHDVGNGGNQRTSSTVIPIVLRHGDVVIMMGQSRLAKHAVPVILFEEASHDASLRLAARSASKRLCLNSLNPCGDSDSQCLCTVCKAFEDYVLTTRINMNVRQVVPAGCDFADFQQ